MTEFRNLEFRADWCCYSLQPLLFLKKLEEFTQAVEATAPIVGEGGQTATYDPLGSTGH
jgi:hypothetical protein